MRAIGVCLALVVAFPAVAAAQWNVTLQGGVHFDRLDRSERIYRSSPTAAAFSDRGEATTIGIRATRWLTGHFGADLGLALAQNRAWYGVSQQNGTGDGGATIEPLKRTLFVSAVPVVRVFAPDARLHLRVGAGPALVLHGGHGESLLTRSSDLGFTALGDAGVRLGHRLELALGAQNYRFTSRFVDPRSYPSTPVYRSEWVVLSGLRLAL